jgi:hypothetical protein
MWILLMLSEHGHGVKRTNHRGRVQCNKDRFEWKPSLIGPEFFIMKTESNRGRAHCDIVLNRDRV